MVVSLVTLAGLFGFVAAQVDFLAPDCTKWGHSFSHGQVFHRPGGPGCLTFLCTYSRVLPYKEGCRWRDNCYDVGVPVEDTKCKNYTCTKTKGDRKATYQMVPTITGCVRGGVCQPAGSTFTESCTTYNCTESKQGGRISYEPVRTSMRCQDGKICHPVGSEYYMNGCKRHVCTKVSEDTVDHVFQEQHCQDGDKCRPVGSEYYMNGCERYVCSRDSNDTVDHLFQDKYCQDGDTCHPVGSEYYMNGCKRHVCSMMSNDTLEHVFQEQECQSGDTCRPVGSEFFINGCERHICTRTSNDTVEHVFQNESSCCHRGVKYEHEQIFSVFGEFACLKYKCIQGVVISQDAGSCCHRGVKYEHEQIFPLPGELACLKYKCIQGVVTFPDRGNCCYRGAKYLHGYTFYHPGESKCVWYRCSQGVVTLRKEGCEVSGSCVPKGWVEVEDCKTHTCEKIWDNIYQIVITRTRCRDIYGRCYRDGTSGLLARNHHGLVSSGCRCLINNNGRVNMHCTGLTHQWN